MVSKYGIFMKADLVLWRKALLWGSYSEFIDRFFLSLKRDHFEVSSSQHWRNRRWRKPLVCAVNLVIVNTRRVIPRLFSTPFLSHLFVRNLSLGNLTISHTYKDGYALATYACPGLVRAQPSTLHQHPSTSIGLSIPLVPRISNHLSTAPDNERRRKRSNDKVEK